MPEQITTKPFVSRRQQRMAFARKLPFAARWAKQTDFATLPEHKDAGTMAGAPLAGPGGLLSTPGLGSTRRRKGRKWGMRHKDYSARAGQTISGNLGRAQDGKFTRVGVGGANPDAPPQFGKHVKKPKKPKKARGAKRAAKPKQTPEQRAQAQAQKRAQNAADVAKRMADTDTGLAPSGSKALLAFAEGTKPDAQTGAGLASMGLAEQALDGSYRMTPTGHAAVAAMQAGDFQRAVDAISRGADTAGKRTQRQQERAQRQQASAAKRAEAEAKRQARAQQVAARRAAVKKKKKGRVKKQPDTKRDATIAQNMARLSPAAQRVISHKAAGSPGDYLVVEDPEKSSTWHLQVKRGGKIDHGLLGSAWAALHSGFRGNVYQGPNKAEAIAKLKKLYASEGMQVPSEKSFVVFKDATGHDRWLARTTTAYQDRDGEIISEAALDQDSARMTATKAFGPLRWWHVGDPDPLNASNPAGPGLDIGDCDYSTVIGRTRVESGTFRDPAIARKVAQAADGMEMSPGFFHPLDQPDSAGVFHTIRTFERSVVPLRYARASNLFTGFTVKEFRMDIAEMEKRFKAMYTELGLSPEQAAQFGQQLIATEKAATAQGIAYKDAEVEYPDVVINGVTYKAAPPMADTAKPPMAEMKAPMMPDAENPAEDTAEGGMEEPGEDAGGEYVGDMSPAEFQQLLTDALAPLIKALDISGKMAGQIDELKSMLGGVATKDAGELATLKAQYAELAQKIAQIEGDQPATVLPDEVAQALKSAGPEQAKEPAKPQIESTPDRPWRGWAALTFPELYQNGENA